MIGIERSVSACQRLWGLCRSVSRQQTGLLLLLQCFNTLNMVIIRYGVCAVARGTVVWSVVSGVQYGTVWGSG